MLFNQSTPSEVDPYLAPFQPIKYNLSVESSQSTGLHKGNPQWAQREKLLFEVAHRLDGTIGSMEKGIEASALILVKQGDAKALMKLLLSIEEELKEMRENISQHLSLEG
jgi:hypothetical protein